MTTKTRRFGLSRARSADEAQLRCPARSWAAEYPGPPSANPRRGGPGAGGDGDV